MESTIPSASGVCPLCGGSGWQRADDAGAVRRCSCIDGVRFERLLAEARIPKRYEHCTLENFNTFQESPDLKRAKNDCLHFVERYPAVDFGLLFLGPPGVGKTHLATSALRQIIRTRGDRGLFYDFRDLLREIQLSWDSVAQTSELEILSAVLQADVLVLDDLGAKKPTDWVRDTMEHIITSRYNDKKLTIFTSNYPDKRLHTEETLTDRIGSRLRSRLYEMCKVIEIKARDFRETVRASHRF